MHAAVESQPCLGDLYGVSFRSTVLSKINESLTSVTTQDSLIERSKALAYSVNNHRLYYVAQDAANNASLVYVDLNTDVHTRVGSTEAFPRLTFSPDGNTLYASKGRSLYTVNTQTGEVTLLGEFTGFPS